MTSYIAAASLLMLTLASCSGASTLTPASPPVSATTTQSASTAPAPSRVIELPTASAGALVIPDIEVGDYLEVTGDGLAVRAGPGAGHDLVSEYLLGHEDPIETTLLREEVWLPAGHVVRAQLGPLVVDDTAWVAVDNVPQAGESDADTPLWRTVAPVPYSEIDFQLTWIAVAERGTTFVRVTDRPPCSPCFGDVLPPTVVATGIGAGRVGPWINRDVAWITIAAAAPASGTTCALSVTNQAGESMFFDAPSVDYLERLIPGVDPAPNAGPDAEVWLDVSGDCAWGVTVKLAQV